MEELLRDYGPWIILLMGMAVHWGLNEARVKSQQHQIDDLRATHAELKGKYDTHIEEGRQIFASLERLDERTAHMQEQNERIEKRLDQGAKRMARIEERLSSR